MSPTQERLVCTCIGAGSGGLAGALFTLVVFPYDICFTLSCSGFFGLTAGGLNGACTTDRRYATLIGALAKSFGTGAVVPPPLGLRSRASACVRTRPVAGADGTAHAQRDRNRLRSPVLR